MSRPPTLPPPETPQAVPPLARRRRRFRPTLPEPIRRLGEIADLLLLLSSMAVVALWQETTDTLSRDANFVILAMLFLYLAFAMHVRREDKRTALPDEQRGLRPSRQAGKRGRPPVIPSGHSVEAAREKSRKLRELRSRGVTRKEAARQVDLSAKQAQHLYKHYPRLTADKDE